MSCLCELLSYITINGLCLTAFGTAEICLQLGRLEFSGTISKQYVNKGYAHVSDQNWTIFLQITTHVNKKSNPSWTRLLAKSLPPCKHYTKDTKVHTRKRQRLETARYQNNNLQHNCVSCNEPKAMLWYTVHGDKLSKQKQDLKQITHSVWWCTQWVLLPWNRAIQAISYTF